MRPVVGLLLAVALPAACATTCAASWGMTSLGLLLLGAFACLALCAAYALHYGCGR